MFRNIYPALLALLFIVTSCKHKIDLKKNDLYGKWKYLKVENPYSHPPDSVTTAELQIQKPNILFTQKDSMQIWWGGGLLSHGSFKIAGDSIRVNEILPDGKTRECPFIVSKISASDLVFETSGVDGTRVMAVKE
jgi:hypothetical protein